MSREECVREGATALVVGNLITIIAFSLVHQGCTSGECFGFLLGTWGVATYCVWSVLDWIDRKKESRETGEGTHGKH